MIYLKLHLNSNELLNNISNAKIGVCIIAQTCNSSYPFQVILHPYPLLIHITIFITDDFAIMLAILEVAEAYLPLYNIHLPSKPIKVSFQSISFLKHLDLVALVRFSICSLLHVNVRDELLGEGVHLYVVIDYSRDASNMWSQLFEWYEFETFFIFDVLGLLFKRSESKIFFIVFEI